MSQLVSNYGICSEQPNGVEEKFNQPIDTENQVLTSPFVEKAPLSSSKIILQNMEEVLSSVKKKHRQKYRQRKEQKKLVEAKQTRSMTITKSQTKPNCLAEVKRKEYDTMVSKPSKIASNSSHKKKYAKKPLQEHQISQQDFQIKNKSRKILISPVKGSLGAESDRKAGSILQHLTRTPKKNDEPQIKNNAKAEEVSISSNTLEVTENIKEMNSSKPATNAFEVMMNARNKSLGSNSPGKEAIILDTSASVVSHKEHPLNTKRKLILQTWADQKGGFKRKMSEEMRAAYVNEKLEKRAKKFKKMLTHRGSSHTSSEIAIKSNSSEPALRRKRTQMLCTVESTEPVVVPQSTLVAETKDFLSKLSLPTKKRDSLLGYFSKVISPENVLSKNNNSKEVSDEKSNVNRIELSCNIKGTPKRRSRSAKNKLSDKLVSAEHGDTKETVLPETPRSRPRRSCVEKAKYECNLEVDVTPKKKLVKAVEVVSGSSRKQVEKAPRIRKQYNNELDIETINLDDTLSPKNKEASSMPKKLAPLFTLNWPKPSPIPDTTKARQEFLRSGVPEKLKLDQEKQKKIYQCHEGTLDIFPKLSYLPVELQSSFESDSNDVSFHLRVLSDSEHSLDETQHPSTGGRKPKFKKSPKKLFGITSCFAKDFCLDINSLKNEIIRKKEKILQLAVLPIFSNKRQIVKTWKMDFDRFPTYKCYNQLRAKYRFFNTLGSEYNTEQISESFIVTRSTSRSDELSSSKFNAHLNSYSFEEDVETSESARNGELLFVEKYKPMLFDQVLVNLTPVSQLRNFLANWANRSGSCSVKNSQNFADESIDFSNDSSSNTSPICNSVVLLGPTASGKTNAVFTLANELNFNVLEINAGMKRTGKKLIQELQEATQSHQIRKDPSGIGDSESKTRKNLLRLSLNDVRGKKTNQKDRDCNNTTNDLTSRKCLILIEDADIVSDQTDAGFTDAIYTLAASSKRPVIIVATNPNCVHLQRLMSENTIKFLPPNPLSISKYLAILSLMENCPVSLDDLISLYLYNRQDLRKTLHELQFFIQSGGDRPTQILNEKTTQPKKKKKSDESISDVCINSVVVGQLIPMTGKHFASPRKRRFSKDEQSFLGSDNDKILSQNKGSSVKHLEQSSSGNLYIHKTIFAFYTIDQNEKWRIPFPVDFNIFRVNLGDIFNAANILRPETSRLETKNACKEINQETRSPKKVWLSSATATYDDSTNRNYKHSSTLNCLEALADFYKNVSIASLLVTRYEYAGCTGRVSQQEQCDRLKLHLDEHIAHDVLERSVDIILAAEFCPYNLFETSKKEQTHCDFMDSTLLVHKRTRSIDYEPLLRAICRREKKRSVQERRSTRFYHYLRNICVDVSQRSIDVVCNIFQEDKQQEANDFLT